MHRKWNHRTSTRVDSPSEPLCSRGWKGVNTCTTQCTGMCPRACRHVSVHVHMSPCCPGSGRTFCMDGLLALLSQTKHVFSCRRRIHSSLCTSFSSCFPVWWPLSFSSATTEIWHGWLDPLFGGRNVPTPTHSDNFSFCVQHARIYQHKGHNPLWTVTTLREFYDKLICLMLQLVVKVCLCEWHAHVTFLQQQRVRIWGITYHEYGALK